MYVETNLKYKIYVNQIKKCVINWFVLIIKIWLFEFGAEDLPGILETTSQNVKFILTCFGIFVFINSEDDLRQ